jgi:hypothetical protein
MSCQHGNQVEACDLCTALDASWNAGRVAGRAEIDVVRASALVEIESLQRENTTLRELKTLAVNLHRTLKRGDQTESHGAISDLRCATDHVLSMQEHIAELQAELAAAREDAERYHYIRPDGDNGLRMDAAIDAARKGGER